MLLPFSFLGYQSYKIHLRITFHSVSGFFGLLGKHAVLKIM